MIRIAGMTVAALLLSSAPLIIIASLSWHKPATHIHQGMETWTWCQWTWPPDEHPFGARDGYSWYARPDGTCHAEDNTDLMRDAAVTMRKFRDGI